MTRDQRRLLRSEQSEELRSIGQQRARMDCCVRSIPIVLISISQGNTRKISIVEIAHTLSKQSGVEMGIGFESTTEVRRGSNTTMARVRVRMDGF